LADKYSSSLILPAAGTKRIGIIGLDTSHSVAFTKAFNSPSPDPAFLGYRIVAAYPEGSSDIKSSVDRIPGYTEEVKESGVEIVNSIQELLEIARKEAEKIRFG
jgi:hypothetical protein